MEREIIEHSYTIKTAQFEGPFSLLLSLIEERKLFINDLSLAEVTEDYLNYVKNLSDLNSNQISYFIVNASTLILIKSKSLLPNISLSEEEKLDIQGLEERLKLYKFYSDLMLNIKNNFGKKIIFAPLERKLNNDFLIFLPDKEITKDKMMNYISLVLNRIPKKNILPQAEVKKIISMEEMIENFTKRFEKSFRMNFKDLINNIVSKEDKIIAIVGFLAILELVRNGILEVIQENNFEDIIIEKSQITN